MALKTFSAGDVVASADVNDNFTYVEGLGNPVGSVQIYGGSSAPSGWLLCDGTAVSRSTYSALYAIIGTSYGTGDGSTTFNVPDMRGFFPVGYKSTDTDFDSLGHTGGEKAHTLTIAEMPAHTHQVGQRAQGDNDTGSTGLETGAATYYQTSESTGGGGSHNTLPPYKTFNFIIKT